MEHESTSFVRTATHFQCSAIIIIVVESVGGRGREYVLCISVNKTRPRICHSGTCSVGFAAHRVEMLNFEKDLAFVRGDDKRNSWNDLFHNEYGKDKHVQSVGVLHSLVSPNIRVYSG